MSDNISATLILNRWSYHLGEDGRYVEEAVNGRSPEGECRRLGTRKSHKPNKLENLATSHDPIHFIQFCCYVA